MESIESNNTFVVKKSPNDVIQEFKLSGKSNCSNINITRYRSNPILKLFTDKCMVETYDKLTFSSIRDKFKVKITISANDKTTFRYFEIDRWYPTIYVVNANALIFNRSILNGHMMRLGKNIIQNDEFEQEEYQLEVEFMNL